MCVFFLHNSEKTLQTKWKLNKYIGDWPFRRSSQLSYRAANNSIFIIGKPRMSWRFFVCCIRFSLNKKFVLFLCCEFHTIMRIRSTHRWRLARCRIFTCSIFDILHDHGIGVFFHLVVHSLDDPDAIYLVIFFVFVLIQIQSGTNDVLHFFDTFFSDHNKIIFH